MDWRTSKEEYFMTYEKLWEIQISVFTNKVLLAPHHTHLLLPCLRLLLCPCQSWAVVTETLQVFWDGSTASHPAICFIYSFLLPVHRHHVKTGKVDFECHAFNARWGVDYYFIELHGKALCLLLAVLIKHSIHWHHNIPSSQKKKWDDFKQYIAS